MQKAMPQDSSVDLEPSCSCLDADSSREDVVECGSNACEKSQVGASSDTVDITLWRSGALVDRIVDDLAGIWVGAVIRTVHPGHVYDIVYADTGALETYVEGDELRTRQVPFQLGQEFWEQVCHFAGNGELLCAVQQVERAAHRAATRNDQILWSILYHCNFGRCGARCSLDSIEVTANEAVKASAECARVAADPNQSPLAKQRLPWKIRYSERYQDMKLDTKLLSGGYPSSLSLPSTFGASAAKSRHTLDSRLRFGRDALKGTMFDPMLGQLVAEDGGDRSKVMISRGRAWFAH